MATGKPVKIVLVAATAASAILSAAAKFPNPADFNPTWESAKPGTSYSTDLPTAALLGNGSLGAVNGGDRNHKKFVLTRGDLWSCGDFTYGKKEHNIGPISFADLIVAPGLKAVSSTDTLDLPTATLVTEGKFGKGKVRLESYVAADEDLLVISGVSDTDDTWILRIVAHNQKKSFPVEAGISDDGFWVKRSTLNLLPKDDPRGWTTNATAAVSALGAELSALSITNGIEARANASIHANKPFAFVVSTNPARRFTWEELVQIKAAHVAWWKEWWNRSRVTTGDAELDRFYHGQVYLLGAGVRSGKFPPGLYGIWVTRDDPKWHNDFHLNYNYVSTYYGCFAANRCEVADTMPVNGKNVRMYTSTETNVKWPTNPGGGIIFLENVIPGENYAFDITDETRMLATNGINGVIATCSPKRVCGNVNQTPKLYSIAARVGYPAAAVIDMFKKYQLHPLMQKNFHLHDNVHGMEKLGAMEFIQSMLIQCDHGIVKVFPNWTGADAKFENLRAKGCFLVSAEMKDGKVVRVEVKSEKGGRFRLVDPRQQAYNSKLPTGWARGKTRNSGEATLEREFKPGETVVLNP